MSTTCASIRSRKCSPPPSCPQPITTTWGTFKPTSAPTPCVGKLDVQVKITTDQYPSKTTWTLTNECGLPISTSGGPFTTANAVQPAVTNCLEAGQYKFTINDAFGDGICCGYGSGSYAVVVDGVTTLTGGQFLYVESKTFGTCTQATQAPVGVSILFFLCILICVSIHSLTQTFIPPSRPQPPTTPKPTSSSPTRAPTKSPTSLPTSTPTEFPTRLPTQAPVPTTPPPATRKPTTRTPTTRKPITRKPTTRKPTRKPQ